MRPCSARCSMDGQRFTGLFVLDDVGRWLGGSAWVYVFLRTVCFYIQHLPCYASMTLRLGLSAKQARTTSLVEFSLAGYRNSTITDRARHGTKHSAVAVPELVSKFLHHPS